MNIITKQVSELKDAPYNPRINVKENPEFYAKLKRSIDKFGIVEPIVWNKRTGFVVGGNQRLAILRDNNVQETEVVVVDLPDNDEKALNIALNKVVGDWDMPKLNDLLLGLKEADYNIADTGFDDKELNEILDEFREVEEDDFELPKEAKYKVNAGDIFQLGNHRLMCGDSTKKEDVEKLMDGNKADMVFTDPPYSVGYEQKTKEIFKDNSYTKITNDELNIKDISENIWRPSFKNMYDVANDDCSFYMTMPQGGDQMMMMMMMMSENWLVKHELIWIKQNAVFSMNRLDYDYQHEPIMFGWKNKHNFYGKGKHTKSIWKIERDNEKLHPTMKPIELINNAILNSSLTNNVILDLFGGSGSTLIACEQTQRQCRMMEIDPYYCSVIIERWETFTGQQHVKINA